MAETIEEALRGIQFPKDTKSQKQAEATLEQLKEADPQRFLETLLSVGGKVERIDSMMRNLSLVIFRQCCEPGVKHLGSIMERMDKDDYDDLFGRWMDMLLELIKKENERPVLLSECRALGTLSARILPKNNRHFQSRLLPSLLSLIAKDDSESGDGTTSISDDSTREKQARFKEGFLLILEIIAEYSVSEIVKIGPNVFNLLRLSLDTRSGNSKIKVQSTKTLCAILISLHNRTSAIENGDGVASELESLVQNFEKFKELLKLVILNLNTKNEDTIQSILSELVLLIQQLNFVVFSPLILVSEMGAGAVAKTACKRDESSEKETETLLINTVRVLTALIRSESIQEFDTRKLSAELLISLSIAHKDMGKNQTYVSRTLSTIFEVFLCAPDISNFLDESPTKIPTTITTGGGGSSGSDSSMFFDAAFNTIADGSGEQDCLEIGVELANSFATTADPKYVRDFAVSKIDENLSMDKLEMLCAPEMTDESRQIWRRVFGTLAFIRACLKSLFIHGTDKDFNLNGFKSMALKGIVSGMDDSTDIDGSGSSGAASFAKSSKLGGSLKKKSVIKGEYIDKVMFAVCKLLTFLTKEELINAKTFQCGWNLTDHKCRHILNSTCLKLICEVSDIYRMEFSGAYLLPVWKMLIDLLSRHCQEWSAIEKNQGLDSILMHAPPEKMMLNGYVLNNVLNCIKFVNEQGVSKVLKPMMDVLFDRIFSFMCLNKGRFTIAYHAEIKCSLSTAIGTTALVIGGDEWCDRYYQKYLSLMMDILTKYTAKDATLSKLRGKSMECVGLLGEAIGAERFKADAHRIMEVLLPLAKDVSGDADADGADGDVDDDAGESHKNKTEDRSDTYNHLNQLFSRICRCIGDDFTRYFELVIPHLIRSASLESAKVRSSQSGRTTKSPKFEDKDVVAQSMHLRGLGDATMYINAVSMHEKQNACRSLLEFCRTQPKGFYPYCVRTAQVIHDLMGYMFHPVVRTSALALVPYLLKSAVLGLSEEQCKNEGHLIDCIGMCDLLLRSLLARIAHCSEIQERIAALEVLSQAYSVIAQSKGIFNPIEPPSSSSSIEDSKDGSSGAIDLPLFESLLNQTAQILGFVMEESLDRRKKYRTALELTGVESKADDNDEMEGAMLDEFYLLSMEEQLMTFCIDIVEWIYQGYNPTTMDREFQSGGPRLKSKECSFHVFDRYFTQFVSPSVKQLCTDRFLQEQSDYSSLLHGMCFLECVIEYGGLSGGVSAFQRVVYQLCKEVLDDPESRFEGDLDLRQNGVFGLGLLCKRKCPVLCSMEQRTELMSWLSRFKSDVEALNAARDAREDGDSGEQEESDEELMDKQLMVSDNLISSIGKMLVYVLMPQVLQFLHENETDPRVDEFVGMCKWWVCELPTQEDVDEMHELVLVLLAMLDSPLRMRLLSDLSSDLASPDCDDDTRDCNAGFKILLSLFFYSANWKADVHPLESLMLSSKHSALDDQFDIASELKLPVIGKVYDRSLNDTVFRTLHSLRVSLGEPMAPIFRFICDEVLESDERDYMEMSRMKYAQG